MEAEVEILSPRPLPAFVLALSVVSIFSLSLNKVYLSLTPSHTTLFFCLTSDSGRGRQRRRVVLEDGKLPFKVEAAKQLALANHELFPLLKLVPADDTVETLKMNIFVNVYNTNAMASPLPKIW